MRPNALMVVLAVNLALAAGFVYLWSGADRSGWQEPQALPPSLGDIASGAVSEPIEISRFRETLERPLFASTRRIAPRNESRGESRETADSLKDVRLLGTYVAAGRGGVVVVRGGKLQRVAVGDRIGEWKVAGEEGRWAVFVRADGEQRKLELALNPATQAAPNHGKTKAADAEPAVGIDAGGPSGQTRSAAAERADPEGARSPGSKASAQSSEAAERLRQQRIQRINERRAARGLPPAQTDK